MELLNSPDANDNMTIQMIPAGEIFSIIPLLSVLNNTIPEDLLRNRLLEMVGQGYQCHGHVKVSRTQPAL